LTRNYYNPNDRRMSSAARSAATKTPTRKGFGMHKASNASSNYSKDLSGNRIGFLNSNNISKFGTDAFNENGEKLFSPKINEKSKLMSPRDRESTFDMLHQ
jgi:hypothetical protein